MSNWTISVCSRSTAQCSGVVPSDCAAFTSPCFSIKPRTRATSPALTASMSATCATAGMALAHTTSAAIARTLYIERLEIGHTSGAVDEAVQMHANLVEQCQVEVRQRGRVLVANVPAALETS